MSAVVVILTLWAIVNVTLSAMNVRNSRRNAADATRNFDIMVALKPEDIDFEAVQRAMKKHGGAA